MKIILALLGSWIFPGASLTGQPRWVLAWLGSTVATSLVATRSVWLFALFVVAQLAWIGFGAHLLLAANRAGGRLHWGFALLTLMISSVAVVGIRAFAITAIKVPSTSMAPTVAIGDRLLIDRLTPHLRGPARGEVVLFQMPCTPGVEYMKRVVALAGQTVEIRCNVTYVDGVALADQLVAGDACRYDEQDEMRGDWSERRCSEYRETSGNHSYHVFHDPERPARDARRATLTEGDARDFPRLDGARSPPSCGNQLNGSVGSATNQLPGTLISASYRSRCRSRRSRRKFACRMQTLAIG